MPTNRNVDEAGENAQSDCAVLVFARAPIPGHAKKRLIPALGAPAAAALQQRMTEAVVQSAIAANIGKVTLFATPDLNHPSFAALVAQYGIALAQQHGETLGQRMQAALCSMLPPAGGSASALLIGADCPGISAATLQDAHRRLQHGVATVVAPAVDGGYVLIGVRDDCPALFDGIDWGSERVMAQTRQRLQVLGITYAELPAHHDIDRPSDLERLRGSTLWDPRYVAISHAAETT